ncbi:MAG: sulfatase [Phycisphaerales bacterium]
MLIAAQTSAAYPPDAPNILLIFLDDAGYGDLGCYGNPTIRTPNLDALAAAGAKFTQFYSASPACTASRYSLLTGRYPVRSGFRWVLHPESERGLHTDEVTLATVLREAGYRNAIFGKWHLGSKREFFPLQRGFDEYFGIPYSNDMLPPRWPDLPLIDGNEVVEINPDQQRLTGVFTDRAMRFMSESVADEQRFFCYLAYTMPHVPLHPGDAFAGRSRRGAYGDVIEEIDANVGKLVAHLKALGIAEDTLVLFTSDNGPWIIKNERGGSAGPFRDGKGSTWEGGVREPAIACWPGVISAGTVIADVCSTLDVLPTVLEMLGRPRLTDRTLDGVSMLPLLCGRPRETPRPPLFYYGGADHELSAVRRGPWKLHIATYSQTGQDYFDAPPPLLFHLEHDPGERWRLESQATSEAAALKLLLDEHAASVAAEGTLWDPPSE